MMLNGQGRDADRTRMERISRATGQSMGELHEERDARVYAPVKEIKAYNPNTGQHYPDFLEKECIQQEPVKVTKVKKPKRIVNGKALSDDKYREELDAQRKRAEALAWLKRTPDGIPDDCLKGDAAARRKKRAASSSSSSRDNTLKLVGEREAADKFKDLESRLVDVQARLRAATAASSKTKTTMPVMTTIVAPPDAPAGWRVVQHPSSKQYYYVNQSTGEQSWSRPGECNASAATAPPPPPPPQAITTRTRPQETRKRAVDPLDPGGADGRWTDGLHHKGERMADSTATGPLWQQRPYPAPSAVLKMRGPGVREGSSIGPSSSRPGTSTSSAIAAVAAAQAQPGARKPVSFVPRQAVKRQKNTTRK